MTGRSIPEWVAKNPDQSIPPRVKLRVWERCGGRCALTGKKLMPGDPYDFDHIVALVNGGRHAEDNLQVVSRDAHKVKTREDLDEKSKVYRIRAKHLGLWKSSGPKIRSRGFDKPRKAVSLLNEEV